MVASVDPLLETMLSLKITKAFKTSLMILIHMMIRLSSSTPCMVELKAML